jgi:hypothetical protein
MGEVTDISEDGSKVVGFCAGSGGNQLEGYIWTPDSGMVGLGVPQNTNMFKRSWAFDYAENGDVIGQYLQMGMVGWKACIKTAQTNGVFVDLNDYLENLGMDLQGWDLLKGHCISDDGTVLVGTGVGPEGFGTWIIKLSPVGFIEGNINIAEGNGNISDVVVTVAGNRIHPDESGNFSIQVMEGNYEVKASLFGYNTETISNIEVEAFSHSTNNNLTLTSKDEPINTPMNVEVNNETGFVTWDSPLPGYDEFLGWDNGDNFGDLGYGNEAATWRIASRFDTESLSEYSGGKVSELKFIPKSETTTYTIKIWSGITADSLLLEQPIESIIVDQWNTIALDQVVHIDGTKDYWFSIEFDQPLDEEPAGYDNGPAISGYGDMIFSNNSWYSATSLNMDLNWNLKVLVTDDLGRTFPVQAPKAKKVNYFDYASLNPEIYNVIEEQEVMNNFETSYATSTNTVSSNLREISSYNLYFDDLDNPIETNFSETEYQLEDLTPDTHYSFGIRSVYENGEESELMVIYFHYQREPNHFNPVNLAVDPASGLFTWDLPTMWMHWDNGINYSGIGIEEAEGTEFGAASKWEPTHTADYNNSILSQIRFFPLHESANYTLKVWTGENGDNEIMSQEVPNPIINDWNTVQLDNPVTLDASTDFWFGLWITNAPAGELVLGVDEGPAVTNYGDMILVPCYNGGNWTTLNAFGLSQNWNIQGCFTANTEQITRDQNITGFNVYLNNEIISENITELQYQFDELQSGETYTAGIQAFYDDGDSEIETISFTYNPVDNDDSIANISTELKSNYPNPFNPTTEISYSLNKAGKVSIEIYNVRGQRVRTLVNDTMSAGKHKVSWHGKDQNNKSVASGLYFYRMTMSNYSNTRKMMLMK